MLRQLVRDLARRGQRAVVLEQPREDVLAGEQLRLGIEDRRPHPLRRPVRDPAVGPARLVQQRVERVAGDPELVGGVVQEGRRLRRELEQVVQLFRAVAHAQLVAVRAQAARGQRVAVGKPDVVAVEVHHQRPHALTVLRETLVVAAVALDRPLEGRAVDVVDRHADPRHAAGHERLAQPVGREGEIREHAQPAEALPEHAPRRRVQRRAQQLGVAHDRVGAEVRQVLGTLGRRARASSAPSRAGRAAARGSPAARGPATPGRAASRWAAAPRIPARPAGKPGTASRGPRARRPRGRRP